MQQYRLTSGASFLAKKEITVMYAVQYQVQKQMKVSNMLFRYKYRC